MPSSSPSPSPQEVIDTHGLAITSEFVPWSRSRSYVVGAGPNERSLNWRVTLTKYGNPVLTTDHMAGLAHCPGYRRNARWTLDYSKMIEDETETGRHHKRHRNSMLTFRGHGVPIEPKTLDVIHSLVSDASVLDEPDFESWAVNFGYDTDSRRAEQTYRLCLTNAIRLQATLGAPLLAQLREAFQDY